MTSARQIERSREQLPPQHAGHRLHAAGGDRPCWRAFATAAPAGPHGRGLGDQPPREAAADEAAGAEPAHARPPHAPQPPRLLRSPSTSTARASSGSRRGNGWSCRRGRAVRLVEELGLRTQRLQPVLERLKQISQRMDEPPAADRRAGPSRPAGPRAAELRKELCHLMRITLESPATLRRRIARIAACATEYEAAKREPLRRQPAAGRLHRQALSQPRPELPGPDPGGEHGPDAGGRQVRARPRLQVLHLRHLVDSPGHHPGHRRPEPHHPRAGPHDRDHEPGARRPPRPGARERGRADRGRDRRGRRACRRPKPPACCG